MKKKTPIEMQREQISKTVRTLLRLKYSLMADEAINETLPETLEEFEKGIQSGKLLGLANADKLLER